MRNYQKIGNKIINEFFASTKDFLINNPIKTSSFYPLNKMFWAIIFFAIIIRIFFLDNPIRIDEASTFLNYVKGNPFRIFYYSTPNNHIFFTFLVKCVTFFCGTSPVSLRLVSFFSGIFSIILTFKLCRKLNQSGLYAILSMSITPYLILYSINARSYSFTICIFLGILLVSLDEIKEQTFRGISSIAFLSAIGLLTTTGMILPVFGIYLWIYFVLIFRGNGLLNSFFKYIFPLSILTLVLTAILYTPTILLSGIDSIINNEFVSPLGLVNTIKALPSHFTHTVSELNFQIPKLFLWINYFLTLLGIISYLKAKSFEKFILLPTILLGGLFILISRNIIPYARSWIFLIPLFLIIADEGFSFMTNHLSKKFFRNLFIVLFVVAILFSRNINEYNLINSFTKVDSFPEAEIIMVYLKDNIKEDPENYNLNVSKVLEPPLHFYGWYYNFPITINGFNFIRQEGPLVWYRNAKEDLMKLNNKIPKKRELRDNNDPNLKQLYLKKMNQNETDQVNYSSENLINIGEFSIYLDK